jgi:D-alanine-D-alanine ligase
MKTVCVLFGGVSTEYLISQRSAFHIINGLKNAGYHVLCTGITKKGEWLPFKGDPQAVLDGSWEDLAAESSFEKNVIMRGKGVTIRDFLISVMGGEPDVIFPALHGVNCEDGTIQGLLELSGFPYVGSGVLASAVGMNKVFAKKIFKSAGIPQCRSIAIPRKAIEKDLPGSMDQIAKKIGFPCFLKPANGGSSVGTHVARDPDDLITALKETAQYDSTVLVEEFVDAREIETAIMGNERSKIAMIGEVVTTDRSEYYDYHTKYFDPDGAILILPADLTPVELRAIRRYAKKAYKELGCSGLARVDFFICRKSGAVMINEVNTMPGFTPISLFPKAFELSGVPLEKLLDTLCDLAIDQKKHSARLEIL